MSNQVYTVEEIKNKMASSFEACSFIDKVYLFGSYARNEATKDSDIDLVVRLRNNVGMKLYSLYDKVENILNKKTDILTENEIMNIMPKTFEKDKVLIYER